MSEVTEVEAVIITRFEQFARKMTLPLFYPYFLLYLHSLIHFLYIAHKEKSVFHLNAGGRLAKP